MNPEDVQVVRPGSEPTKAETRKVKGWVRPFWIINVNRADGTMATRFRFADLQEAREYAAREHELTLDGYDHFILDLTNIARNVEYEPLGETT